MTWSTLRLGCMIWACSSVIAPKTRSNSRAGTMLPTPCSKRPRRFSSRLSYNKSCTGGGGDPHPPAAYESIRIEGTILRDADILEQLGAIGILRVAAKIGRDTRYPTFTDAAATLRKALTELPGKLHLDPRRRWRSQRLLS